MDMQGMAQLMQMFMSSSSDSSDEDENAQETASENQDDSDDDGADFGSMFDNINFDMLNKMGELFSHMNKPDRNAELLLALKPHLRDENQYKVDSAIKLSRMMTMLPYIKESGMLNDLF